MKVVCHFDGASFCSLTAGESGAWIGNESLETTRYCGRVKSRSVGFLSLLLLFPSLLPFSSHSLLLSLGSSFLLSFPWLSISRANSFNCLCCSLESPAWLLGQKLLVAHSRKQRWFEHCGCDLPAAPGPQCEHLCCFSLPSHSVCLLMCRFRLWPGLSVG